MDKKLIFYLLISMLIFTSSVYADKIYLKNGRILKGKIIEEEKNIVKLRVEGGIVTFRKDEISSIEYEGEMKKKSLTTGIEGITYTNLIYQCQISKSNGWVITDKTSKPEILVLIKKEVSPEGSAPNVSLSVQSLKDLPCIPTVSEYAEKDEEIVSLFKGYKKVQGGIISLGNKESFEHIFITSIKSSDNKEMSVKYRQLYFIKNEVAYIITCTDLEKTFKDNLDDFNFIIKSFTFL